MKTLQENEVEAVGGAVTWQQIGVGLGMVSLAVSIAATGGLGGLAVGLIVGAGYGTDLALALTAVGLAGGGGAMIGAGMAH